MAHDCPECDIRCHCQGDIDDLVFNDTREQLLCKCCEGKEDEEPWDWEHDDFNAMDEESNVPYFNPAVEKKAGKND